MVEAEIKIKWKEAETVLDHLKTLYSLLKKLVNIIRGLPEEVERLKADLKSIQASIEAVAREDLRETEAKQLKQTKELAFKMEDVIDDYEGQEGSSPFDLPCAPLSLPDEIAICVNCKTTVDHLCVAVKIEGMKSPVQKIKKSQEEDRKRKEARSDRSRSLTETESKHKRNTDILEAENIRRRPQDMNKIADIVGLDDPCNNLIDLLRVAQEDQRIIITVRGMGGTGKSALARKVFLKVAEHIKCRAWIDASKYSSHDETMFEDIWDQLPEDKPQPGSSLKAEVEKYLKINRYVVVFDDVRDNYFWNDNILGKDSKRLKSVVIITTRNKDVANTCLNVSNNHCNLVRSHEMVQQLTERESSDLFTQTALRQEQDSPVNCSENCLKDIVNNCKHFPLGIVAIGREIAIKKYPPEEYNRCPGEHIKNNAKIAIVLRSSYEELSEDAKSCLLYFGMYPEGHQVKLKRLIRQWTAEGFAKCTLKKRSEEVAKSILDELTKSSLVQVSSFIIDGKTIKSYGVHYFVHAMILGIIQDLSFCQVISDDSSLNEQDIIRRLSIGINFNGAFHNFQTLILSQDNQKYSLMRSLLFFTKEGLSVSDCTWSILSKPNRLKVLDFEGAELLEVPETIGNYLVKLKYLSFRKTKVKKLPQSIGMLQNLETLDLRQTGVHEIPKEVGKLTKLQHLLGDDMSLKKLKDSIGAMKSLQSLYSVKIDDGNSLKLVEELGKLTKMRDLRLTNVSKEHEKDLCFSLSRMQDLEKLHIVAKTKDEEIDLQNLEKRSKLRKSRLQGNFKLPSWIKDLPGPEHQTMPV